jgi:hypothetical protein
VRAGPDHFPCALICQSRYASSMYKSGSVRRLPVAAQVFQVWWYALNEERLSPDADLGVVRTAFPDIVQQPRAEQKRRLRQMIEKHRKNRKLLADPATDGV